METHNMQDQVKYQKLFMGIILASFTHELRNHLAMVKETSGLQQDLIAIDRKVKDVPGLMQTLHSVDEQIDHAVQLISFLNRFAHRMDSEEAFYPVVDVLEELMVLVRRLARQRGISLETDFSGEVPPVVGNPGNLQMLAFFLLDEKIRNLPSGSAVLIRVRELHGGVMITIVSPPLEGGAEQSSRCPHSILLSVARGMGAEVIDGDVPGETGILLAGAW